MSRDAAKCGCCGTLFVPTHGAQKWCTPKCGWKDWNDRQPKKKDQIYAHTCERCGKDFESRGAYKRRFCSRECRVVAQNATRETTQHEWRTCPVCDEKFQPKQVRGVGRTYCSRACREKWHYRRRKFGTSQKYYADYDALFKKQGGKCAICGEPETIKDSRNGKRKKLAIDHCHGTGKLRGLLCTRCNTGLGCFVDDPTRLAAAITYLSKFT